MEGRSAGRAGPPRSRAAPTDLLALQRTRLAVERTFLAFVRTGLAILAGAVGIPYLFEGSASRVAGWALGAAAATVVVWGTLRFRVAKRRLEAERRELMRETQDGPAG